jgi:hypothetical protein
MALTDLLYRCPACGADPLEGKGAMAHCADCGTTFDASTPGGVLVTAGSLRTRVPAAELLEKLSKQPRPAHSSAELASRATLRETTGEVPLRYRGRLLGFREEFGPAVDGSVRLDGESLRFNPTTGADRRWDLAEVRAVQGASSTLQVSLVGGQVLLFRFADSSPLRWEEELHTTLRKLWTRLGRGDIEEFQPWIRASGAGRGPDTPPDTRR